MDNKTADFLGPQYNWKKTKFELQDAHPLKGALYVLLPSYTAHYVFVTRTAPDGNETKHKLRLGWDEKEELCALCVTHDFVSIASEAHPGQLNEPHPEEVRLEARSTITVTNSRHESHAVSRRTARQPGAAEHDTHFNAIYQTLLALAERTAGQRPMVQRLQRWQMWLIAGLLIVALVLIAGLAYFPARALVSAWWPTRFGLLFGLHIVLMALLLGLIALLGRHERRTLWWDRTFTNPFMLAAVNLFFFIGLVGDTGLLEQAFAIWRGATVPQAGDERAWYGVLAYGGLFAAGLTLLAAALVGKRLLGWLDERW
jgi:hypothetical protein